MSQSTTFNQHIGAAKALWELQDELSKLGYDHDHPLSDVKRIFDLVGDAAVERAGYVDAITREMGLQGNRGLA
jgi:hypothetical protein